MEDLLQELLDRWELAFDERQTLARYKAQVKSIQYADGPRYDLRLFEPNSFPSDGPLMTVKVGSPDRLEYEYGFNDKGFPCFMTFGQDHSQAKWEGFYNYSGDLVEYVEFCLSTGVPSALKRIKYHDGRKISWQSLSLNARGSAPVFSSMSKEAIIDMVRTDKYSLISTVTRFQYDQIGKIEKAFSLHVAPGLGSYSSFDEYNYGKDQELDRIRTFFDSGDSRITYCRVPEKTTADGLIEELAAKMATAVASALANCRDIEQPVALLELSYHYADNYYPYPIVQSAREVAEKLEAGDFSFLPASYDHVPVEIQPFERLFAQMEQMMQEQDDMDIGTTMWRRTAALLTRNKLFNTISVTDDFAAFAIDWSVEGHSSEDLVEILLECGVGPKHLEAWRKKGMLPRPE